MFSVPYKGIMCSMAGPTYIATELFKPDRVTVHCTLQLLIQAKIKFKRNFQICSPPFRTKGMVDIMREF